MQNNITLEIFLKQKLNNFILYLEKTIGKNNKLYPQVQQLQNNEQGLINYAEYLVKVAKINPTTKKYYFEESTIIDYLENNGFNKDDIDKVDNNNFIKMLIRYLELFVNTIA